MKKYIGTIVNTRAYQGELIVDDLFDLGFYLEKEIKVSVGYSLNFASEMTVKSFKIRGKKAIMVLDGVNDNIQAKAYKEMGVFVEIDDIKKKEEKIFLNDLIGFKVFVLNDQNRHIGNVKEVWKLPANDVLLVETERGDNPIPMIDDVVKIIDEEMESIFIETIPGLLELGVYSNEKKDAN